MTKKDAIKLLELPDAEMYSVVEIRKAYRKAMQKNHPDHGGSTEMAQNINEARENLIKNYVTYIDPNKEPILTKEQKLERIKFNIEQVFKIFLVKRTFFTKSEELYTQLKLLMRDDQIIKEVSQVNNPGIEYIFSVVKPKAKKIITTYVENYCALRGIKASDLSSFDVHNIEFPFDPDDYVSKLQNAYIVYSKKFMENYAKEIENYDLIKNEINKIIKNLPYDESRPISELTSIFVKKYYDIYKMKTDYNYLQMKYKANLTNINSTFIDIVKRMSTSTYWDTMDLKRQINDLKKSTDTLGNYLNINEEDIIKSEIILQKALSLLGKCHMFNKSDLNMDKLKSYLNINILEIKFPFMIDYFISLIVKIEEKAIDNFDKLVEAYCGIETEFSKNYGIPIDKLQRFMYEPIDKTKLDFSSPLDFNKIDKKLAIAYKRYIVKYVKTILNNDDSKFTDEEKHAIVEKIFSNLYIYSKEDINDIIYEHIINTFESGKHL